MDNNKLSDKIEKEQELADYQGEDRVVRADELKAEIANQAVPLTKLFSNIPSLDKAIEYFEGGELIVISGPTKNGKTTFAQTLTKNFEDQGLYSLWFSYEVTMRQLFTKFAKAELFYLPRRLRDKDMKWLEDRIIEAKLKYNVTAVFIDHLHYLVDMARAKNPSLDIGQIIRTLKMIAIDQDVVIFLLAHMSKTKYDATPNEGDVRDSSFIPQEADSTFLIWREKMKEKKTTNYVVTGKTYLMVSNYRRTGTMGLVVPLLFKDSMLYETDASHVDVGVAGPAADDPLGELLEEDKEDANSLF